MANDCTLNNLNLTSASGFNKTPVVNGRGSNSVTYSNIVSNGDFSNGTTGWSTTNAASQTVSNNINTVVASNALEYCYLSQITNIPYVSGKKLYVTAKVRVTNSDCSQIALNMFGSTSGSQSMGAFVNSPLQNQWYTLTAVWSSTGIIGNYKPYIIHSYANSTTANGKTMEVKEVMVIDLTTNADVPALETNLGRVLTVDDYARILPFTSTTRTIVADTQHALTLDGSDDYGAFVNTPSLDITTNEFALCATFRVAVGSPLSYLIYKGLDSTGSSQYALIYNSGNLYLYLNGASQCSFSGVSENTWYNVIFYRNSSGVITPYLNKVSKSTATYANVLTSQPNIRLGARSSSTAGTSHTSCFKGDKGSESIYQASTLNIQKIIRAEMTVSKNYTGVA